MPTPPDALDLTNLPRFLEHLGHHDRDPMAAAFAKRLLNEGHEVVEFWSPEQMDVWRLTIRRGAYLLTLGVERGFADQVTLQPVAANHTWPSAVLAKFAILGWARAHDVKLTLDDPHNFHADLLAHGSAALDWLGEGHDDLLLRIDAEFRKGFGQHTRLP